MASKAEIAAELAINIGPFQQGLHHATEGLKEFANKAAETGSDITRSFSGIDLAGALKVGVVAYAIEQLAEKVKDVAGEALKAFADHETEVLSLKLNIKGATDEIAEGMLNTLEGMAGIGGTVTQLVSAFRSLKEAGLGDTEAIATLRDLQNEYIKTGVSVDDYAESLRKAQAGGADQGEGLNRLLKSMPDLAPMIQEAIDSARNSYLFSIGHGPGFATTSLKPEEQAHLDAMPKTASEFVKEHGLNFKGLLQGIHQHAPADAMEQASKTLTGMREDMKVKLEQMYDEIGKPLAPAMKAFLDEVTTNLPAFTKELSAVTAAMGPPILDALKTFGEALGAATNILTKNQAKGGGEDVNYEAGLQGRGSLDVGGRYQYGHQPGQKSGESSMDWEKHLLADIIDEGRYNILKNLHMTVPETMALQSGVQGRLEAGGLTPDGKHIGDKIDKLTNSLRSPDSPWTPLPGDIDY